MGEPNIDLDLVYSVWCSFFFPFVFLVPRYGRKPKGKRATIWDVDTPVSAGSQSESEGELSHSARGQHMSLNISSSATTRVTSVEAQPWSSHSNNSSPLRSRTLDLSTVGYHPGVPIPQPSGEPGRKAKGGAGRMVPAERVLHGTHSTARRSRSSPDRAQHQHRRDMHYHHHTTDSDQERERESMITPVGSNAKNGARREPARERSHSSGSRSSRGGRDRSNDRDWEDRNNDHRLSASFQGKTTAGDLLDTLPVDRVRSFAEVPATAKIEFFANVRGNHDLFMKLVDASIVLTMNAGGQIRMSAGDYLICGGNVLGQAGGDIRVVKALVKLKMRHPDRVFLLLGDIDVQHIRLVSELAEGTTGDDIDTYWDPNHVPFSQYIAQRGLDRGSVATLQWILEASFNLPHAFEARRAELTELYGRQHSDGEVLDSYVNSVDPKSRNAWMLKYVQHAQMMAC